MALLANEPVGIILVLDFSWTLSAILVMCTLITFLSTIALGCFGFGASIANSNQVQFDLELLRAQPIAEVAIDGNSNPITHNSADRPAQIVSVTKISRPTLISIAEFAAIEPASRFGVLRQGRDELACILPNATLLSLYCIWLN